MATVTRSRKASKTVQPVNPAETVDAPTLQDQTAAPVQPVNPALRVEIIDPSGDANTVAFKDVCTRLDQTVRGQSARFVSFYAQRGALLIEGIDVKVAKARSKDDRAKLRAAALDALEATAKGAYDPASEPLPNLGRWLYVGWLTRLFPSAEKLEKVGVAETIASGVLTRVDPPASWDAPETWELKRGLDHETVDKFILRAAAESFTQEAVKSLLDSLWGATESAVMPKKMADDPAKAARNMVDRIVSAMREDKLDVGVFFSGLQSELARYGWFLVKDHGPNGAETLKPVKHGR